VSITLPRVAPAAHPGDIGVESGRPSFPDVGIYKGEELRDWMREWARTWQDNRFEMLDFTDHGDAGLIKSRWHLAAPSSGGQIPVADFTQETG
jgi:hypothetical protein